MNTYNKPTLYLIRGVPGAGKTTFANMLQECGLVINVHEADSYFYDEQGNYNFEPSLLSYAHKLCKWATGVSLDHGNSCAVSNTSTTENEVKAYKEIADLYDANFVSIIVENRHGNENRHNVPKEKVEQMKRKFDVKL